MGDPALDEEEFRRWRDEADGALRSANIQADAGLHNWGCFSSEQAAKLGVKALLHGLGRGPWGPDLVRLGEMATEASVGMPGEISDALKRLSRHYIAGRYPDAHASGSAGRHYGEADARQALEDAQTILRFVDEAWGGLRG
jgi:HEPN domain-containing protein